MTTESDQTRPLTIAEVYELPAGTKDDTTWIDQGVTAVVRKIEKRAAKTGNRTIYKCTLGDPTGHVAVEMALFAPPRFNEGDVIEITGKGIRRTEYNGTAQIDVGKKVEIHVLGQSVHHEEQATREAQSKLALDGEPFPVPGQTVGNAINNAIELRTHTLTNAGEMIAALEQPEFWHGVYTTASDIIRVARLLEKGRLAPAVKERKDPEGAKRAAAEREAADKRAAAKAEAKRRAELEEEERQKRAKEKPLPGPGGAAFQPGPEEDVPF